MTQHVIGAQLYTVRQYTKTIEDVRETLKKVAQIGYTAVQVSGFGPVDTKEVAQAAEDNGLTICCTHVGWDDFLKDADAVIEKHQAWKCTHPAIGGLWQDKYKGIDGIQVFADELAPVAEKLAKAGMDFSYHNHDHEFWKLPNGKTWLETLYDTIPAAHLKAELDVFWVQAGGADPAAWVRKMAGRQPLLHLKDMVMTEARERHFAPIGEGNMNWPAILDAARDSGVHWMLVEQDDCYGADPFEALATSYKNLRGMGLR